MILPLPNILSTLYFLPMQFAVLIDHYAPQDNGINGLQNSEEWLPSLEIQKMPVVDFCAIQPIELCAPCRENISTDGVDIVEVQRWAKIAVLLNQLASLKMASSDMGGSTMEGGSVLGFCANGWTPWTSR